jgi:methyltransferase-like protein
VDENRPIYFHEFAERAEAAGLQWLADTNPAKSGGAFVSPEVRKVLANTPLVQRCQLLDFLRNESFHKSLVCHRGVDVDWTWSLESRKQCQFILVDLPQPMEFSVQSSEPLQLTFPAGKMATRDPLGKSALAALIQNRPRPTSLAALHDSAMQRLPVEVVQQSRSTRSTTERVALAMSGLLQAGLVKAYIDPPRFADRVSDSPTVTRINRLWAERNDLIVSQLHENVRLTQAEAFVVARLDGETTRQRLGQLLAEAIQDGRVTATPAIRDVREAVDQMLTNFAARAILSA